MQVQSCTKHSPARQGEECPKCQIDHLRAVNAELLESLGWFVTFHSGHVLPPELCNAMVKARNLLENNIG